jgi:hypothetical protein
MLRYRLTQLHDHGHDMCILGNDYLAKPTLLTRIAGVLGIFESKMESTFILPHFMDLFMAVVVEKRGGEGFWRRQHVRTFHQFKAIARHLYIWRRPGITPDDHEP